MAQPIHCDVHDRGHLADVLVSQIATGDVMAACFPGYIDLCRAIVADADAKLAELAALEAAMAAGPVDPDQAEVDATDAAAEARLAGERSPEAAALGVSAVVPKGASRSRRAYQARQRAKGQGQASTAGQDGDAAPGGPGELSEADAADAATV